MYHSISDRAEPGVLAYYKLCTSPARFRSHIQCLKANGYHAVDLPTGLSRLQAQSPELEKTVVITFDDGFRDFYDSAVPALTEAGFCATMFLPSAFISPVRRSFAKTECMTWPEVLEAQKSGMHFGAHTHNHALLYNVSWRQIHQELEDSKKELEHNLGRPVSTFAYPFAFPTADKSFCSELREILVELGYDCCVTTTAACASNEDDAYNLPRLPVNEEDDDKLLLSKLQGAYDWVGMAQGISKRIRRSMTSRGKRDI